MNLYLKLVLVLLVAAATAWHFLDTRPLTQWFAPKQSANSAVTVQTPLAKTAGALRKCKKAETIVYTNSKCPPGSVEEAVSGGTVNIVKAQPSSSNPAKLNIPPIPHARELLGQYVEPTLRDEQLQQSGKP